MLHISSEAFRNIFSLSLAIDALRFTLLFSLFFDFRRSALHVSFEALSTSLNTNKSDKNDSCNEPFEGSDSFVVLVNMNESIKNDSRFYPGFQHLFYWTFILLERIFRVQDRHVNMSIRAISSRL